MAARTPRSESTWIRGLLVLLLASGAIATLVLGLLSTQSSIVVGVDGNRQQVRTHATTVGAALNQAGYELYPEDLVTPSLEAQLQPGTVVEIRRANPALVAADGQTHRLRTHAKTIGDLLSEAGVQLGAADEIWIGEDQVEAGTPFASSALMAQASNHWHGPAEGGMPVITVHRANSLTLEDDGTATVLYTTADTVGQVLEQHGMTLYVGDAITPNLQDRITEGMTIAIHRSVPVEIVVDGKTIRTRTRAETVAGLLGQEGIALMGKDTVAPSLSHAIQPSMTVRVTRIQEEYIVEFDPIPFESVWVADPNLEIDNTKMAQPGQVGLTKRRYRVIFEDGDETDRSLEATWSEQPPITKTMAYGTKIVIRTMDTPDGPIEYWRKMRVYTTAYTAASSGKPKDHPRYGYTRLGWFLVTGIVAVDPDVIPLKSEMYVPGYGKAIAGDTGGGVKGKFVDLGYSKGEYKSWHWWSDIYLLTPVPAQHKIRWVLPDWPKYPDRRR